MRLGHRQQNTVLLESHPNDSFARVPTACRASGIDRRTAVRELRSRAEDARGAALCVTQKRDEMAGQKIRIRLKSYDHAGLDASARKIVVTS